MGTYIVLLYAVASTVAIAKTLVECPEGNELLMVR
jgi:hypothetical protein